MNIHKTVKQALRSVRWEQIQKLDRTYKRCMSAEERIKEVAALKKNNQILLSKLAQEDNSYSAMMRQLRQEGDKEKLRLFQATFKKNFEQAYCEKLEPMEQIALMAAIKAVEK